HLDALRVARRMRIADHRRPREAHLDPPNPKPTLLHRPPKTTATMWRSSFVRGASRPREAPPHCSRRPLKRASLARTARSGMGWAYIFHAQTPTGSVPSRACVIHAD